MSEEDIWEAISDLREDRASFRQILLNQTASFEELKKTIKEDIERGIDVHGRHDVELAEIKKDVDAIGSKIRGHLESHWKWAALVVSGAGTVMAAIKGLWKSSG